jgi:hypothetical protein
MQHAEWWARRKSAFAHPTKCREMDCFRLRSLSFDEQVASLAMTALKNEYRQLIQRISDFEAHQNQCGDHQIKAEMHEGLETIYLRGRRRSRGRDANQTQYVSGHTSARLFYSVQEEQKASAAAEVMLWSRASS